MVGTSTPAPSALPYEPTGAPLHARLAAEACYLWYYGGGAIDTTSPLANLDDIVQRLVGPHGHGWYTSQSTLPSRGCTAATVASYIHDAATLNDDPISRARLVAACVDNNITGMAVRTMAAVYLSMDDVFERAIVDHPLRQRGYRSNLR